MGCASSKPSSSAKDKNKKNIKSKTKSNTQNNTQTNNDTNASNGNVHVTPSHKLNGLDSPSSSSPASPSKPNKPIELTQTLIDQIEDNNQRVIDYISHIVHKDLNAELIASGNKTPTHHSANMASVVLAAAIARDNDDLIKDVASKAVYLITNKNPNYVPNTYKDLNDSLKATQYLHKHQTNKHRIIDLTVDTISNSLDAINQESQKEGFNLVNFLNKNEAVKELQPSHEECQLTPPQTPETKVSQPQQSTPNIDWDNAQLLSRAEANEVARILFLSNKARPIVHASPKAQDAYIVNKQIDNTEVTLTKGEIDEILNRYDEPKFIELVNNFDSINLSPISPQSTTTETRNVDDTPQLSSYANKPCINLSSDLSELSDNVEHDLNRNDEFTNVTQDVNETIQFVSNEETDAGGLGGDSLQPSEIKIEYLPGAVNNQNEQSDNAVPNSNKTSNRNSLIYETTTIITKTTLIATPVESDLNLDKGALDPLLKQSLLDDRFYNNDSFKTEPPVNGEKENEAATTIQAAFRGHEARQDGEEEQDSYLNTNEPTVKQTETYDNVSNTPRQQQQQQQHHEEELNNVDSEKAAIKIQATFRGFKTRKDLHKKEVLKDKNNKNTNESTLATNSTASLDNNNHKLEKSVDLNSTLSDNKNDLVEDYIHNRTNNNSNIIINTPICSMDSNKRDKENESQSLLDRAATKIQSTFRGYKTRKVIKTSPNTTTSNLKSDSAKATSTSTKSLHDNPELAAIKIQSTFRGYKTRKQLKPKLTELHNSSKN